MGSVREQVEKSRTRWWEENERRGGHVRAGGTTGVVMKTLAA